MLLALKVEKKYTILLLITDGEINDIAQTQQAISRACLLPMSIIIIGVGDNKFEKLKELDGDGKLTSTRDCVQFVRFRDYANKSIELLGQDTLKEIPIQFLKYMKMKQIIPKRSFF